MTQKNIENNHMNTKAVRRFDLTDKVALVVGGAGYLGVSICRGLAEHGAHVIIADIKESSAREAADLLNNDDLSAESMCLDLCDEDAVKTAIDGIVDRHGNLDIVVNCAIYSTGKPFENMSMADWEKGMRISLSGAFVLSREASRVMVAQGSGSIIQFSSMYGKVAPDPRIYAPDLSVNPMDYGVAKAGISQMTRYQAVMLAPKGVRVNSIVPGPFPDPRGQGSNAAFVKKLSDKVPMARVGKAEEIVGAVIFLASDVASFVTGTEIVVDGGWTAW